MSIFDIFRDSSDKRTQKKMIGDIGEDIACEYLISQGYSIIARNVRVSKKELDIIAENDLFTVFFEVKTLSLSKDEAERDHHRASEQISQQKAQNTIYAAQSWHNSHYSGKEIRIDVIEVYLGDSPARVVHTQNAINKLSLYRRRR